MTDTAPPSLPSTNPAPPAPKRRRGCLWVLGGLLAVFLIVILTVVVTWWWIQRPIKPVVLSEKEKVVVDGKIAELDQSGTKASLAATSTSAGKTKPDTSGSRYVAGVKELRLTERELNGLLNTNTDLGKVLHLELDRDAVNAYLAIPIPKDAPVLGGRMFRARGRFVFSVNPGEPPVAMLEDVTIFGFSLPKDWLGGIKGKNLLADAMSGPNGRTSWRGIKSLRIEPGVIILEVGD